jgi:hypothetical protein
LPLGPAAARYQPAVFFLWWAPGRYGHATHNAENHRKRVRTDENPMASAPLTARPASSNVRAVTTWRELSEARPDLSAAGEGLLYQFGVGLAFLATIRPDTGPRLHPMCPILHDGRLFAFIVPSPKQRDLDRDGRYAMHCFPPADNEDAFYLTGRARRIDDADLRAAVGRRFVEERSSFDVVAPAADDGLFELDIDTVLLSRTTGHGDPAPQHTVWKATDLTP